ncbi:zinc finger, CCHC-type containing protein, partial [Tanacetum coccineum]
EAWTRFKDLLQKVPHHGIDLWLQVQIFFDYVNFVTRRTIDQSANGKLHDLNAEESWELLEDLALYDNESWNDLKDFSKPVKAITLHQDVPSTSDRRLIELENQVQRLMEAYLALTQPTQVNKFTTSCEIYSGPQDTQYCIKDPEQVFVEYASLCTDKVGEGGYHILSTPTRQQHDDVIGKINLLWKTISEKLNDVSTPENAGNSMAPKSIAVISQAEREELRKISVDHLDLGGSLGRDAATGRGEIFATEALLHDHGLILLVQTIDLHLIVRDLDNVGSCTAELIHEAGGKVVAMATVQNINNTTRKSILHSEKLTGSNFTNWHRNLRIVLRYEKKSRFMEQALPQAPNLETPDPDAIDAYYELVNTKQEVARLMLSSMSQTYRDIVKNFNAYDMLKELKTMFKEQAKHELFKTLKAFHACKQDEGQSVSSYLLKMKIYLDTLERLGFLMLNELGVSLILSSLNKDYEQFVHNYNMHSMGKTIDELHAMLKLHEKGIPKKSATPAVFAIRGGCGIHIYNTTQGLRRRRKMKHGALNLYVCNGMRAVVEPIGSFDLILPNGLVIVLDTCHYAPSIIRGVFSVSRLIDNGYMHTFLNYGISVMKDDVFYFNAIPRDGIYEIYMQNIYPNVSSIYNVSNKRAKRALESTYLWHCRFGHINKKRIEKLQRDGIL